MLYIHVVESIKRFSKKQLEWIAKKILIENFAKEVAFIFNRLLKHLVQDQDVRDC